MTNSPGSIAGDLAIRLIPCLDVKDGRVVKGTRFKDLQDAGDPVELAARYGQEGADELTFLDISASEEGRATMMEMVRRTAEEVFIPLTVGGGIRSRADVDRLLRAGADKVSINTAAIEQPELINEIARTFGSQVLVISIDARRNEGMPSGFEITTHGGKKSGGRDARSWAIEATERGVGEVLLNSMDADGTRDGFDIEMIASFREVVRTPLIASGGAGRAEDFPAAIEAGADAVLAASVFHYDLLSIRSVKEAMAAAGYRIRSTEVTQ
jgi:cyclase